ncbi:MAG: TIGR02710 family CRISPR-associated CARF protein [Roseiflexaceae bacterium]|nr:TIGR02710 family CRISPR-associated CARF protein [Roseiflexaceae bacterium]
MAATILITTVGGSSEPVIRAIHDHRPDHVLFIASADQDGKAPGGSWHTVADPGNVCDRKSETKCPQCKAITAPASDKPSIVIQAGLTSDQYSVLQVTPDDLTECYQICRDGLENLKQRFPNARLVTDYTGGTKTMSAALALAAIERGDCELGLVTGARNDLHKVTTGTETALLIEISSLRVQRQIGLAAELFDHFDYAAAELTLTSALANTAVSVAIRNQVQRQILACRGFAAWDRFDHVEAQRSLTSFAQQLGSVFQYLLTLNRKGKYSGYEAVFDLIANAERCAKRQRYDDAVARLYRATELLAQQRLDQHYQIRTSAVDLLRLPEALRESYATKSKQDGIIQLGLQDNYQLLFELNDPLGHAYQQLSGPLRNALTARNNSILAHGQMPMNRAAYHNLHQQLNTLIQDAQHNIKLGRAVPPFPEYRTLFK